MDNKRKIAHNALIFFTLAVLFIIIAIFYSRFYVNPSNYDRLTKHFQSVLLEKENSLDKIIFNINSKIKKEPEDSLFLFEKYIDKLDEDDFLVLIFKNNQLKFWSDNSVAISEIYNENNFQENFGDFSNGWYEIRKFENDNYKIVGLIKIKNVFEYENQYLKNDFQKDFSLPCEVSISKEENKYNVYNKEGKYIFSLHFPVKFKPSETHILILTLLYLIAFVLIIITTYQAYLYLFEVFINRFVLVIGFIIDLLIIRFITFYFEIPHALYSSRLFSPEIFADSNLIPSLGDLLFNAFVLLSISFVIHKSLKFSWLYRISSKLKYLIVAGLLLLIFTLFITLSDLLQSLIVNSAISFDLYDITSISINSIIGFVCFGLLILSFVFLTFKLSQTIVSLLKTATRFFTAIVLSAILFYIICCFLIDSDVISLVFLIIYISSFWFVFKSEAINIRFSSTVFYVVLFSLFSTYILFQTNNEKENENRKIIAQKLSQKRDPAAEFLFGNIASKIQNDTLLKTYLDKYPFDNEDELDKAISYIKKNHFSKYWEKYELLITICDDSRVLDIQPEDYLINCFDYFQNIIDEYGEQLDNKNLYYLSYDFTSENYLGIIDYTLLNTPVKIAIEIFSKYIPKGLGYPELLIDKEIQKSSDWSKYSWARYENGELVYHFGKYFYSMNLSGYGSFSRTSQFFNENDYNHFYYQVDENSVLIISDKKPGLLDIVAPFSYIFIFYGLMLFLALLIFRSPIDVRLFDISLKKRLQLSVTALIVISFLFIGAGSLYYIISLNNHKNHDILSEKTHSVLIELEHKLAAEESLSPEISGYLSDLLYKFSLVFFSDINLYDIHGTLLATSRPEIFNKRLISAKMDPGAFNYMSNFKKSLYIHSESIGDYEYLSAYVPFRNEQNKLIAYLNLPYFAKQDELTNEISTFLVAFVNIYVIFIAIAIFIALVISNYITKPVQLIKEKISRLKLGKTNEKIEWTKNDEIGGLVMEYNRMVDELANSANLLAKSERESAWREMAKQIAHEIKNPLTPMKLSVQYLQKSYNEKTPDWDKRLKRFTQTIIEQIDSLSIIATEFSDFAKMPKSKFDKTEVTEVIRNAIGLFKNTSSIRFKFNYTEKHYVLADKEQLLRVFNNLIKNSIQAISDPEKGEIKISVEKKGASHIIKFSDNGHGIPKEQKEKVFYPNFTTKTGGMGLGLALVKNIIQSAGGEITFESEQGEGTTFVISLPVYE